MKKIIISLVVLANIPTWAAYQRLAECYGRTERNINARAILFVNTANDTQGFIAVSIDRVSDSLSETKINWTSNTQGYPRFYDNNFDLDIVIDDKSVATDDMLVENEYIPQLQCRYTPKN
jgi:hypothetical protein